MNINSYLTSLDDNLDNLSNKYISNYQKINIYNNNIRAPNHKIWLQAPKLKISNNIYFPTTSNQIALLSVILWDVDPEIKKFMDFIINLEKNISIIVNNINNNLKLKSCIKKNDNNFPILKLQLPYVKKNNMNLFTFNVYNIDNKLGEISKLENNSYIKSYIELTDVWMNETEYGLNWRVLQMKVFPEFDFRKCLFTDEYVDLNNIDAVNVPIPPAPPQNKKNVSTKFIPTPNELVSAKNNLKSRNKDQ